MKFRAIITLFILLILTSCSVSNQQQTESGDDLILPDMVLEKGRFTLYQEKENPIEFTAEKVTFYSKDNRAVIENISFEQKDKEGAVIIEGHANEGEIDTENETLVLTGDVFLNSVRDDMTIRTDGRMDFNTRTQEVETSSEVTVQSPDGEFSSLSFYGNLLTKEYSFSKLEKGRIII